MTRALMTAATLYNDQRFLSKSELRIYKNKLRRQKIVRRQRFVLGLIAALLVFAVIFFAFTMTLNAKVDGSDILYKYYKQISVDAGDSLWSIASANISYEKYDSIDDYIAEVCSINHIEDGGAVMAGEDIIIPYYSKEFR
ncbi:MAG: hypothetical protein J5504_02275 [Butyrivibrio sp.]|nr:hypothetical protein [Butyrivibrio sp.]